MFVTLWWEKVINYIKQPDVTTPGVLYEFGSVD